MVPHRIKKNAFYQLCLALLSLALFSIVGCGGSGSGGGSSSGGTGGAVPAQINQSSADIHVDKTSISCGDVVLDKSSDQTITIQNTGSSNLIIGQIGQANPLSAPFSILTDDCSGKQLAPTQTCTLQVRFSPTTQGAFQDTFDIPSNDPVESSVTASVSGTGRGLNVVINKVAADSCPKVTLLVTVTDKNNNPQLGLTKDYFSLFENGVGKPVGGASQVSLPVSTSLVLDYSNSMQNANAIPNLEAASKAFIDQLNAANHDEASIIKYARDIYRMQMFTTDHTALKAAISAAYPGDKNHTKVYDAVWYAADDIATRANRKAIIVVTDGQDNYSTRTLAEVIAHANEKGANVFTIGLGTVNAADLQQMADQTGGLYFNAPTSSQLKEIYLKIAEIIAGQYMVEYNASSGAGTVALDLEVAFNGLQGKASTSFTGCP